jgi:fumarate hydratase, class II
MPLRSCTRWRRSNARRPRSTARWACWPPDKASCHRQRRGTGGRRRVRCQFPLSVWQTGSGTQSHMNVNEVVAHLASQALALGGAWAATAASIRTTRSTWASRRTTCSRPRCTWPRCCSAKAAAGALALLRRATGQGRRVRRRVKVGRTHLQDATPITLGQEFGGYDAQLALAEAALLRRLPAVHALAIGGTAVGTGLNTHPEFGARVAALLASAWTCHSSWRPTCSPRWPATKRWWPARRAAHAGVALTKIANDIRLMGSGPRAGSASCGCRPTNPAARSCRAR